MSNQKKEKLYSGSNRCPITGFSLAGAPKPNALAVNIYKPAAIQAGIKRRF